MIYILSNRWKPCKICTANISELLVSTPARREGTWISMCPKCDRQQ